MHGGKNEGRPFAKLVSLILIFLPTVLPLFIATMELVGVLLFVFFSFETNAVDAQRDEMCALGGHIKMYARNATTKMPNSHNADLWQAIMSMSKNAFDLEIVTLSSILLGLLSRIVVNFAECVEIILQFAGVKWRARSDLFFVVRRLPGIIFCLFVMLFVAVVLILVPTVSFFYYPAEAQLPHCQGCCALPVSLH